MSVLDDTQHQCQINVSLSLLCDRSTVQRVSSIKADILKVIYSYCGHGETHLISTVQVCHNNLHLI